MQAALIPIMLVLAALHTALGRGAVELGLHTLYLLVAPLLHLAGRRLESAARSRAWAPALLTAPVQVGLGAFLVGGAAWRLLPEPSSFAGALGPSLLLGLALSADETLGTPSGAGASRGGPGGPGAVLEAHSALCVLLAAVLLACLQAGGGAGLERVSFSAAAAGQALALGLAAGAAAGLAAGVILLRRVGSPAARELIHLAAAELAVLGAVAAGGAPAAAAVASGILAAASGRRDPAAPPEGASSAGAAHDGAAHDGGAEAWQGAPLPVLLAAAGTVFVAGEGLDLGAVPAHAGGGRSLAADLPWALLLWGLGAVVRLLVQLGFGGLWRWRHPHELPVQWLPALSWASYPGALSAGLVLLGPLSVAARPLPGGDDVPLLAVALALLLQGTTARAALLLAQGGAARGTARERWEVLLASLVALKAERRAVEELEDRADLEAEAALAMKAAIAGGERDLEEELCAASGERPELSRDRLPAVVRAVLARAQEEVMEAGRRGWISPQAAAEVERHLARRWLRSPAASLHEVLGSFPGRSVPPRRAKGAPGGDGEDGGDGGRPAGGG